MKKYIYIPVVFLIILENICIAQPGNYINCDPNYQKLYEKILQESDNVSNIFYKPSLLKSTKIDFYSPDSIVTFKFFTATDSTVHSKRNFENNSLGQKISEKFFEFDTASKVILEKESQEYSYDAVGNIESLLEVKWMNYLYQMPVNIGDTTIYVDTLIKYYFNTKFNFVYNSDNHVLSKTEYSLNFYNSSWSEDAKYIFETDSIGNILSSTKYNNPYNIHAYLKDIYEYDSFNNKLSEENIEWNFGIKKWISKGKYKYEYVYSASGKPVSIDYYYWSYKNGVWIKVMNAQFNYNVDGKRTYQINSILDSTNNQLIQSNKYIFVYQNTNKIFQRINYYFDKVNKSWDIVSKDYYYYTITNALSDNVIENQLLNIYPNPVNEILSVKVNDQSIKFITISGVNGQLLGLFKVHLGSNHINISHLKKGMYFIKVTSGNSNSVIKMIKK